MKKTLKQKKILSWIMIFVGLPMALACVVSGGGLLGYLFAAILAVGVDMLTDTIQPKKI